MNTQIVQFIKSAADPSGFIADGLPQIVFAGKSNVGKSSVINKLLQRRNFARSSATPGKTAHVNYFKIENRLYFTDLPGYGFAKVSHTEKQRWKKLMEQFFNEPYRITLGIMIVDARHKPTADDQLMAAWFLDTGRPFVVVANKLDKLKKSQVDGVEPLVRETLGLGDDEKVILFSAETGTNRGALISEIEKYVK